MRFATRLVSASHRMSKHVKTHFPNQNNAFCYPLSLGQSMPENAKTHFSGSKKCVLLTMSQKLARDKECSMGVGPVSDTSQLQWDRGLRPSSL